MGKVCFGCGGSALPTNVRNRLDGTTFVRALHSGLLGFEPGWVHPELEGVQWRACLPDRPAERIAVRHTVGFADALSADEVTDDPGDGLPVDLEAVVAKYGVSYFKVKTAGDAVADRARLARLFSLCAAEGIRPHLTVDGNESMRSQRFFHHASSSLSPSARTRRSDAADVAVVPTG